MAKALRILMLEERAGEFHLAARELRKEFPCTRVRRIHDPAAFHRALKRGRFDLVVSVEHLAWMMSDDAASAIQKSQPACPVALIGRDKDGAISIEAIKGSVGTALANFNRECGVGSAPRQPDGEPKQEEWETIFQAIGQPALILDAEQNILAANRAALLTTGKSLHELRGKKCWEVFHGKQKSPDPCPVRRMLESGHVESGDMEVEALGGWYVVSCTPLYDHQGRLSRIIHIATDITDRKLAEMAAEQSETRYRDLFDHMSSGVAVYEAVNDGEDFVFKDFNRAGEWIENVRREDIVGKSVLRVFPGMREFGLFEVLQRVYRTGVPERLPLALYKDDRISGWKENYVFKLPSGEVVAIYDDVTERKRNEAKFQLAFDHAAVGMCLTDPNTRRFLQVNEALCQMLGYTSEELLTKTWLDVTHPDDVKESVELVRRLLAGESPKGRLEKRYLHKNGNLVWGEVNTCLLRDELGHPLCFITHVKDITVQKTAEAALRRSEQEKTAILNSMSEYVTFLDMDMRVLWANRNVTLRLNLPHEEIVGRHCYELRHRRDRPCENCPVEKALRSGRPEEAEMVFPDDESAFIIRANPVFDEGKRLTGIVEVSLDISAIKRTQEALRHGEEFFRSVLENVLDIVTIMDSAILFQYVSPSVTRTLGYLPSDLLGQNGLDYVHPDDLERVRAALMRVRTGRRMAQPLEFRFRHHDGTWRTLESIAVNQLENPVVSGILIVSRDVTALKQLEEQVRQTQKMEAIGRLAGGIAHDFNNLLTAINGYSEMLLSQTAPSDPIRKDLEEIYKGGQRAAALTRQLLAFSRKQMLDERVLKLNTAISETDRMLRRLIGENIELVTVLQADLHRVKADPAQIEQIIVNLAVNARDAMPQGGKLTIETANVELDEMYAATHAGVTPGQYVLLAVSDTGEGMDAETLSHIFEPFFTTKAPGKGIGLGLSTVYGTVKQGGGHIWVYSEKGRGTTVKIYLPRVEEEPEEIEAAPAAMSLTGSETILLVEDEEIVRKLVRQILVEKGYRVLEASNGTDALTLCEQVADEPIHLLLTDVVQPGMSGRELAERMVKTRPDTKILYMSGYTENAVVHHGVLDEGVNFIQKPFTPQGLLKKMRRVLDGQ